MKLFFIFVFALSASGCVAVKAVDAAASTAVGITKTTVKAGGAAIDATVDTFDADDDEVADSTSVDQSEKTEREEPAPTSDQEPYFTEQP